jgi:hypothetical protein
MAEGTKQLIFFLVAFLLCIFMICFTMFKVKQLDCQNVSKYNNTLQHDINLEKVCK